MRALLISVALALVGTGAAAQEERSPPAATVWRPAVEAFFNQSLKDPYSAVKRQSSSMFRGSFRTSMSFGRKIPAWAVCYAVNAKNSYGAYTGERHYLFLFTDAGDLLEAAPSGRYTHSVTAAAMEAQRAREACQGRLPPEEGEFTVPRGDQSAKPEATI